MVAKRISWSLTQEEWSLLHWVLVNSDNIRIGEPTLTEIDDLIIKMRKRFGYKSLREISLANSDRMRDG